MRFSLLLLLCCCAPDVVGPPDERSTTSAPLQFDRQEFQQAMQKLDAYYAAPEGLQRGNGLSIGGRPDFEGIAAWVFDVYLNARLQGVGIDGAWRRVVGAIEASAEWQSKPHPAVDASTLNGKHLMGYQGWFGTPASGGWSHWFGGQPTAGDATFDVWPDTRELDPDELTDTAMDAKGGGKAKLWSSHNAKTVARHFRWMKEAGIDGVSMGRFSVGTANGGASPGFNQPLLNVRDAAEASGRVFFIWYDVSGHSASTFVADIKADWERLVDQQQITASPSYLRHRGRPLLGIWGVGIGDRPGTPADWANLIAFFKNHPNPKYRVTLLAGGIPGWATDPVWGPIFKSVDVISPWTVGAFADDAGADNFANSVVKPDLATCKQLGLDYMPVAFPGFSWHNLQQKHTPSAVNVFPRRGGRFYWRQVSNIVAAGATNLFTAMFDEADEGTAMMKAAATQDSVPVQGQWLSLDADGEQLSSDFYLRLGGAAGQLLRKEIPASPAPPIRPF